jgi:predicted DNA-binding helix-hairpin-helix protein
MRFYFFKVDEIVNEAHPNLDLDFDPKLAYALRNPWLFPVDINKADYETILRVPGIGVKSAQLILSARRYGKINSGQLKKMGVVLKRAQYFITCNELSSPTVQDVRPEYLRTLLLEKSGTKKLPTFDGQLKLFES